MLHRARKRPAGGSWEARTGIVELRRGSPPDGQAMSAIIKLAKQWRGDNAARGGVRLKIENRTSREFERYARPLCMLQVHKVERLWTARKPPSWRRNGAPEGFGPVPTLHQIVHGLREGRAGGAREDFLGMTWLTPEAYARPLHA